MIVVRFALHNGIGQNLTAAIIVFAAGWLWSRPKLRALHERLEALAAGHAALHAKLEALSARDAPASPPSRPDSDAR